MLAAPDEMTINAGALRPGKGRSMHACMEQARGRDARTGRSHPEGLLVVPYAPVHSAALSPAMST